jgi:hypothetical protein
MGGGGGRGWGDLYYEGSREVHAVPDVLARITLGGDGQYSGVPIRSLWRILFTQK